MEDRSFHFIDNADNKISTNTDEVDNRNIGEDIDAKEKYLYEEARLKLGENIANLNIDQGKSLEAAWGLYNYLL